MNRSFHILLLGSCALLAACSRPQAKAPALADDRSCAIVLAPHSGGSAIDKEIARLQGLARSSADPVRHLERLGWAFVAKARSSYDPGYYKLAEQTGACIDARYPGKPEALLLRGHALHNMHRFKEAEVLARSLVEQREFAFDHGLLGDVLMEQGKLNEAAAAYQKMIDLKPGLQSYSRGAHLRWLKGDLTGAIALMKMAAQAASPADSESGAWAYSRLALLEFQNGEAGKALQAVELSLSFQKDYAPALLVRGRILLAQEKSVEALAPLKRAAEQNPLPEYQWVLAEALRVAGRLEEASDVEKNLVARGDDSDPRTLALYLATRGEQLETAVRLAEKELGARADVFTLDAFAWSLAASGRISEARSSIDRALSQGTRDARLYYHAGAIAAASGNKVQARNWLERATRFRQMLLPSERRMLAKEMAAL